MVRGSSYLADTERHRVVGSFSPPLITRVLALATFISVGRV